MKPVALACAMLLTSLVCHANIAKQKFDMRAIELKSRIDTLELQLNDITNDLASYKRALDGIRVAEQVVVTNTIRLSKDGVVTKIHVKTLSDGERKIRRLLMSFDDPRLARIYCKYFPDANFKRLKEDFKEDFKEIKRSHEELVKTKGKRRSEITRKMNELNASVDSELKKRRQEYESDLRAAEQQSKLTPRHLGYNELKQKRLVEKYGVVLNSSRGSRFGGPVMGENMQGVVSEIKSRLAALDDAAIRDKRLDAIGLVREEANTDVDEESEERFKQDKTRCIMQHYANISSDFITRLSGMEEEIKREMVAAVVEKRKIDDLLGAWDTLDQSVRDNMARDAEEKVVAAVMGRDFVEKTRREEVERQEHERELAKLRINAEVEAKGLDATVRIRELELANAKKERELERQHELELERIKNNPTIRIVK